MADDDIDPIKYGPGSFGCHEALHMASYLASAVDEQLHDHPAIAANPKWSALAQRAVEALAELYQVIGAEHFDAELQQPTKTGADTP